MNSNTDVRMKDVSTPVLHLIHLKVPYLRPYTKWANLNNKQNVIYILYTYVTGMH